ncbi:MAG: hypothetical protein KF873_14955, partial [Gemmataceae bacterium]|nr:hypothetical protein [Gemmataceae bacterium]
MAKTLGFERLEDRRVPTIALVSANPAGEAGNGRSTIGIDVLDQQLSADGRFVVFHTLARDLTPEPDNNEFAGFDVYVRDTVNNTTELVSRTLNGAESGSGFARRISADGRYVLFQGGRSEGPDGVVPLGSFGAANNGGNHVYRRDLQDDKTVVVTAREDGLGGAGGFPSTSGGAQFDMSDDGRYVVFAYGADDLVTGDTNGQTDVFIRDLVAGTTKLVSRTSGGVSGNGGSGRPIISGNGKTVVFVSGATDLTGTSDTNGDNDLFAYDVATGSVTLITKSADGTSAVSGALRGTKVFFQDIDESGTKIIFSANSNKLVENGSFGEILYLHDTVASTTKLISRLPSGVAAGVDGSGSFISQDGKFLSIITGAALTGQTGSTALYLYDVATDAFTLASRNPAGKARNAAGASLSADGRYVAFVSEATDLVPGVTVVEGQNHFVYDRLAGQTFAITTDKTGTQAFGYTVERQRPYISADGRKVAFFIGQSYGFTDNNGTLDVFINDVPLVSPNAPPTITDVANQSTIVGVAVGPIDFTVADAETAAGALSVTAKTSNATLIPLNNVKFGGSGANRTVTVTPAADQTGSAIITVTITDGNGATASDAFTVTVNEPPPLLVGFPQFLAGSDAGGASATLFDSDGSKLAS